MTITFRGGVLVATGVFTFLLARLTQVAWLYMLDAILWGAILLSLVVPWLAVMSLSARRRIVRREGSAGPPGPTEGEVVQVELWLENRRVWPRYLLAASYDCPLAGPDMGQQRVFIPRLGTGTSLASVSTVQCYRRGLHQFGPVTVESGAPFGLFRRKKRLPSPLSVLVYPQVHRLRRLSPLEGTQGTAARPRRRPVGQEITGSRYYFPGDPLRHIHWRNTARLGRPMVKEFEDTQENAFVIAFDSSKDLGQGQDTVLEYSIKLAASVAWCAMQRGGMVSMLTGRMPPQEIAWMPLLTELALLEAGQGPGLSALLDSVPPGSSLMALVSEADFEGMEALRSLAAHMSGMLVVVLEGFGDIH